MTKRSEQAAMLQSQADREHEAAHARGFARSKVEGARLRVKEAEREAWALEEAARTAREEAEAAWSRLWVARTLAD